jgi:hypothetical protein
MKTAFAPILFAPLLFGAPHQAAAQPRVDVQFVEPQRFTDIYPTSRRGTDSELNGALDNLRKIFVETAGKSLKTGHELKIDVLDVNLAGDFPPSQSLSNEVRIMRNIDWPSIKLRYTLKRDGKESQGEAVISDMSYLMSGSTCTGGGALCYERRMVERWFRRELR